MARDRGAPAYFVAIREAGGQAQPVEVSQQVTQLRFQDNERKVDVLSLQVDNFDLSELDKSLWAKGNFIQFTYGYEHDLAPIREAVIRSVKGFNKLTVEAHSKDVIMDRIKVRQAWENVTRSEVIKAIAERNGYNARELQIEDTQERFEILTQDNLTDAQMVRKLCEQEGFEFFVDFDGFHAHRRDLAQAPIREFVYYTDQGGGDIIGVPQIENDITRKPGRVRVMSRDPETKETIVASADDESDPTRELLQEVKGLEEFIITTDLDNLSFNVGSRRIPPESQPTAYEEDIPGHHQTQAEAQTDARRRFRKATQRAVKLSFNAVGDPKTLAKAVIKMTNMSQRVSGRYYVQTVTHTLGSGYQMNLKTITDGFQRKLGVGKGESNRTDASLTALASALESLREAAAAMTDNDSVIASASLFRAGEAALKGRTQAQLSAVVDKGRKALRVFKSRLRVVDPQERARISEALVRGGALVSLARQMLNNEDKTAKGVLNTKDVADPNAKTPVIEIDPDNQTFKTTFVDARSRGQR